ncbi:MAG: TerB family tellurite resistance protein [Bacteroidales bacterium]
MSLLDYFDSRDKRERMSYVLNLWAVAAADGHLEDEERDLIFHIAARHGITSEEFKRILTRPESISFTPPETVMGQIEQLMDMVMVMLVDGEIDEREYRLCKTIARRLGFRQEVIDAMIRAIVDAITQEIQKEIAIERLMRIL